MPTFAQRQNQPQQKSSVTLTRPNRLAPAASYEAQQILHLQHTIGNQAALRLLRRRADRVEAASDTKDGSTTEVRSETPTTSRFAHDFSRIPVHAPAPITIQPKLAVNTPGDIYEQEADHVAEQVMRMPEPKLQRACACGGGCSKCQTDQPSQEPRRLQTKHVGSSDSGQMAAPPIVHEVLSSPGQPLDPATRAFFEPRFGHDFSHVRVHADVPGSGAARSVAAHAFTVGEDIVFGESLYAPDSATGRNLLAHELTHIVQQRAGGRALQRRAANCPEAPPSPPTITTMDEFIALVRRVEASSPTGNDPIATARLISRTKYEGGSWDWMLPSTKGQAGAVAGNKVTANDIASLCFKMLVFGPERLPTINQEGEEGTIGHSAQWSKIGGYEDPMHIVAAIVADAETQPAGTGATGVSRVVGSLPASVSQRGASTWVGDVGKAAGDWMAIVPLPSKSGATKADHMLESAPPHDLMADIDGVAMTSKSAASGFAFDKTKPLSDNLQRFYAPAKRTGRERRFHVFCSAEGFAVEANGVMLTKGAKKMIAQQVKDFAEWYVKNDLPFVLHLSTKKGWQFNKALMERSDDWQWFANEFIKFVEENLAAEGP